MWLINYQSVRGLELQACNLSMCLFNPPLRLFMFWHQSHFRMFLNNVTIQLIFWFKYVSTEVTLTSFDKLIVRSLCIFVRQIWTHAVQPLRWNGEAEDLLHQLCPAVGKYEVSSRQLQVQTFFCEKWRFLLSQLQTSNLFILQDCLRRSWLSLEQIPRFPGSGAGCSDAKPPHRNRCPNPYPSKITYFCQTTLSPWSRGT